MKKFYIIQMADGRYVHECHEFYTLYCDNIEGAVRFSSKKEAIHYAPENQPFTIIKFHYK